MFKLLNPRWQAERCFLPDPEREGAERFHPFWSMGPSYRLNDDELKSRLSRITTIFHLSGLMDLVLLWLWVGFYQGHDRMMRVAPPLLLLAASFMGYRVILRLALKDIDTAPNIWSNRTDLWGQSLRSRLAEVILMAAVGFGLIYLGERLGSLI